MLPYHATVYYTACVRECLPYEYLHSDSIGGICLRGHQHRLDGAAQSHGQHGTRAIQAATIAVIACHSIGQVGICMTAYQTSISTVIRRPAAAVCAATSAGLTVPRKAAANMASPASDAASNAVTSSAGAASQRAPRRHQACFGKQNGECP